MVLSFYSKNRLDSSDENVRFSSASTTVWWESNAFRCSSAVSLCSVLDGLNEGSMLQLYALAILL
jgi:hypothetical protein